MKIYYFFLFIIICSLFLINNSYAISLSPPSHKILFEPNSEHDIEFTLINRDSKPMLVNVEVKGDLKNIVTLDNEEYELRPNSYTPVKVKIKLPSEVVPGNNVIRFEFIDNTPDANGMFRINVGVIGKVTIFRPYPGYYALMDFQTSNINLNEQINYKVTVTNRGKEDIKDARLEIDFFDFDNKKVVSREHESINIKSTESFELERYFNSEDLFVSGKYLAVSKFYYEENNVITKNQSFNVGVYDFKIINSSKEILEHQITPYILTAENQFNGIVEEVYATIKIQDKEYTSNKFDFNPFQEKDITIYIDNLNFAEGEEYNAEIKLFFGDQFITEKVKLKVVKPPIKEIEKPSEVKEKIKIDTSMILIGVVILLMIFNMVILYKKTNNNNDSGHGKKK